VHVAHYVFTWVGLLVLTAISLALSYLTLGWLETPVALTIAVIKATLVALFFMHLWEAPFSYRFALAASLLFVLLVIGLTVADLLNRDHVEVMQPLFGRDGLQSGRAN
jgi:cytochrome c oxidase subunit IV